MPKKLAPKKNLPEVSKQTAGGIGGAVVGGIVAGPVGAIAGGIAGAMMGNASAEGKRPVKTAAATVRAKLGQGKALKAITSGKKKVASSLPGKNAKKAAATKKSGSTSTDARKKTKAKSKPKSAKSAGKSKAASARKATPGTKRVKT